MSIDFEIPAEAKAIRGKVGLKQHPGQYDRDHRGGLALRSEAHHAVQVDNCDLGLAHGAMETWQLVMAVRL